MKKGALILAAILAGIGGLLYYRLRKSPFDWNLFLATFTGVNWGWLILSIILILFTYSGRALRWEVMLRPLGTKPNFWKINSATLVGFTAIFLLGRPGELVRPYLISLKQRVAFSSQMAAWLLERIFDLLAVLLIFGFSLARIPAADLQAGPALAWVLQTGGYIVAGLGTVSLLVLLVFRSFSDFAEHRIMSALTFLPDAARLRIAKAIAAFSEGMRVTRNPANLALLCLYTLLEWAIIVGCLFAFFRAFPVTARLTLTDVMIFVGFVAFGSIIQIPGIGGGVQVVAIIVLTEIFGMSLEAATGIALLNWILTFVVVVPFGLILAFHEGINWRKLKHLREDVAA
jgi:glycosyltransferase 2 family protein